jgi:hypothetical protein
VVIAATAGLRLHLLQHLVHLTVLVVVLFLVLLEVHPVQFQGLVSLL